jgi:hypothetical protein
MKTIILHGQNGTKSLQRLDLFIATARKRGWEVLYDEIPATKSLFGVQRLIVVRNIDLLNKNTIKYLGKLDGTIIIYHDSDLPALFLNNFKDAKIEKYELPKLIWKFLDNPSVGGLHEIIKSESPEFIFALLSRRIRDLYIPPTHYESWQLSRLRTQKLKLGDADIKAMINALATIDIEAKTGKGELVSSLDLFIAKNLE